MKKHALFFFLLVLCTPLFSQKEEDFRFWEDSLNSLRALSIGSPNEVARFEANEDFMTLLEQVLNRPGSFKHPWSGARDFSVLTAPDGKCRIFTWSVQKNDRTVENYGFLQVKNESRGKYVVYSLIDKRKNIDYPQTYVGNQNNWYGAVYYKIIPLKTDSKTYYTLLGYNANNIFTNQKVIEVLYFKSNGSPIFGATIFKKYTGKFSRIIFEYSKQSSFSLKYEKQGYDVNTGRRDPKTHRAIYESNEADMIVFEQLIPMDEGLDNVVSYLVPESSLNQGFIQDNGKWLFLSSVKGRNPDKKMPKYVLKNRNFRDR